jgi:hypothetical protein
MVTYVTNRVAIDAIFPSRRKRANCAKGTTHGARFTTQKFLLLLVSSSTKLNRSHQIAGVRRHQFGAIIFGQYQPRREGEAAGGGEAVDTNRGTSSWMESMPARIRARPPDRRAPPDRVPDAR